MNQEVNQHKIYTYDKLRVFFKHTDYYGFVHPYNYLEWMSYVREAFFQDTVPNFSELLLTNIKMVTAMTEFELLKDAKFGDSIEVKIFAENVRRLSFEVVFEICLKNGNSCLGRGRQLLTFLDATAGRPARIPEELKRAVCFYERRRIESKTES